MAGADLFLDDLAEAWAAENWRRARELLLEYEQGRAPEREHYVRVPVSPEGTFVVVEVFRLIDLPANRRTLIYDGSQGGAIGFRLVDSDDEDIRNAVSVYFTNNSIHAESNRTLRGLRLLVHVVPPRGGA